MSPPSDVGSSPAPLDAEAADAARLNFIRQRVWRQQTYRADRRERMPRSILAWVLSLLLHLLFVLGILLAPVDMPSVPADHDPAMLVQLLPPPPPAMPGATGGTGGRAQPNHPRAGLQRAVRHGRQHRVAASAVFSSTAVATAAVATPRAEAVKPLVSPAAPMRHEIPQLPAVATAVQPSAPPAVPTPVIMPRVAVQPVRLAGVVPAQRPPRAEGNQPMPVPVPVMPAAAPLLLPSLPVKMPQQAVHVQSVQAVSPQMVSTAAQADPSPVPTPVPAMADIQVDHTQVAMALPTASPRVVQPAPALLPLPSPAPAELPAVPDSSVQATAALPATQPVPTPQALDLVPTAISEVAITTPPTTTPVRAGAATPAQSPASSDAGSPAPNSNSSRDASSPDETQMNKSASSQGGQEATADSAGQPGQSGAGITAAGQLVAAGEGAGDQGSAAAGPGGLATGASPGDHPGGAAAGAGQQPGGQAGGVAGGQVGGHPGGVGSQAPGAAPAQGALGHYISLRVPPNTDVGPSRSVSIEYHRTRFDKDWVADNENQLDTVTRRIQEKLQGHHKIRLPGGVSFHCDSGPQSGAASAGLGALLPFGCHGNTPAQGSIKDGDRRLDQAPARPLAGPAKAVSLLALPQPVVLAPGDNTAMCETARVAGGPMPPECPATEIRRPRPASSTSWAPALDQFH